MRLRISPNLMRLAVYCAVALSVYQGSREVFAQTETSPPFEQPNIARTLPDFLTARPIAEQKKIKNTDQLLRPPFASQPVDSAKGLAAKIRAEELDSCNRVAAVQYLGTVDCKAYPEAMQQLISSLYNDKYEVVRYEAAKAIKCMLCGCCDPDYQAMMFSTEFAGKDSCPACKGKKYPGQGGDGSGCYSCNQGSGQHGQTRGLLRRSKDPLKNCPPCYQKVIDFMNPRKRPDDRYISGREACGSCCTPEVIEALSRIAYEKDELGCCLEPSFRVRDMATQALQCCCSGTFHGPLEPQPELAPPPTMNEEGKEEKKQDQGREILPPRSGETLPGNTFVPAPAPAASPLPLVPANAPPVSLFMPHPTPAGAPAHLPEMAALKGFCVVGLRNQEFHRSQADCWSVHRRRIYYFASPEAKSAFDADPEKFAVRFSGMDMVEYTQSKQFVEGNFLHLNEDGHLYLFATRENRTLFEQQSEQILESCRNSVNSSRAQTVSYSEPASR